MLDNVREHSIVVAKIVMIIARGLAGAGIPVSVEKAVAGALLHDIAKTECLKSGGNHAVMGKEICLQHRLDEIAEIVDEHVRLKDYCQDGNITEKEIVYYADKRVRHSAVVSLEERLTDILDRYGRDNSELRHRIRENFRICETVERKLFARLRFEPEDLENLIKYIPSLRSRPDKC
jgi:putative nucleotidyltransferase with HDIG domain